MLGVIKRLLRGLLGTTPEYRIIVVTKGGTSTLHDMLLKSQQVMEAYRKELHYFNSGAFPPGTVMPFGMTMSKLWYRGFFPNFIYKRFVSQWRGCKMVAGEATPNYLYDGHAPSRIKTMLPNVKLVVILRNPVDRAYSEYQMNLRTKDESMTFEDRICQSMRAGYGIVDHGHYANHLKRWFEHFDRERLLILTTDELKADRQAIIAKMTDFLGIERFDIEHKDGVHHNKHRGNVHQDKTAKNGVIWNAGTGVMNAGVYQPMDPGTRKMLVDHYRLHNERLRTLLKRDFDWDR